MKSTKTLTAVIAIWILAVGIMSASATSHYPASGCVSMCYDPVKNWQTKGYDPEFLKQTIVLETCKESHKDLMEAGMKDLGFCSKELGTL